MATRSITRSCSQLSASNLSGLAQAFLRLSPRRYYHTNPLPVLDFLLPSVARNPVQHGSISRPVSSEAQRLVTRSFTSSAVRKQTTAVVNPKKDEDGNDMSVEITPRASNRLKEIMSKDSNPNLALRIQVESGGCHGFQYLMSLTTLPPLNSTLNAAGEAKQPGSSNLSSSSPSPKAEPNVGKLDEDDTVFAADGGSGAKVVMDGPSLELLKGSKVDFTMELIGSQFKIVDNPLATSSCGCGTSFDIKA